MKNSEKYYAQFVDELMGAPLAEKTVIFLESYDEPVHGDCQAILKEMLGNNWFSDWKFRWCFSDSMECKLDDTFDSRIEYLALGSHDFVKACEEVSVIITAVPLPEYYIKKEGQIIIGCFPISFFYQKPEITRKRAILQMTFEKLDVLYTDNEYVCDRLDKMYPEGVPFHVIKGVKPRFLLSALRNEDVVISLTTQMQGEKFSDLERKYKDCKYVCVQFDKDVCFHVDKVLYHSFQQENEPEILSHIISREIAFCKVAKNAKIIITDRILNVYDAVQMQIPCIFISRTRFLPEYFNNQNIEKLHFAENWEQAMELLSGHIIDNIEDVRQKEYDKSVYEMLSYIISPSDYQRNLIRKKGELWVVPGNISSGFWKAMEYYKCNRDISVFVRSSSEGILWKRHIEFSADKKLFCKIGMCATVGKNISSESILRREWKRMIGEKEFQTVFLWQQRDELWNKLYEYVPSDYSEEIDLEKTAFVLYDGIVNNFSGELLETDIEGEKFYDLGYDGNERYYLKAKSDIRHITIIFIKHEQDIEKYRKIVNDKNMTYICIDPYKYLTKHEEFMQNHVYWIPQNIFPLRLLSNADKVVGYGAEFIFGERFKILT